MLAKQLTLKLKESLENVQRIVQIGDRNQASMMVGEGHCRICRVEDILLLRHTIIARNRRCTMNADPVNGPEIAQQILNFSCGDISSKRLNAHAVKHHVRTTKGECSCYRISAKHVSAARAVFFTTEGRRR